MALGRRHATPDRHRGRRTGSPDWSYGAAVGRTLDEVAAEPTGPEVDGGDGPDDLAHYARNDELAQARRQGRPVKALCGIRFRPHADPHRLPVCVVCHHLAANAGPGS